MTEFNYHVPEHRSVSTIPKALTVESKITKTLHSTRSAKTVCEKKQRDLFSVVRPEGYDPASMTTRKIFARSAHFCLARKPLEVRRKDDNSRYSSGRSDQRVKHHSGSLRFGERTTLQLAIITTLMALFLCLVSFATVARSI
jgi:hypothetical protein